MCYAVVLHLRKWVCNHAVFVRVCMTSVRDTVCIYIWWVLHDIISLQIDAYNSMQSCFDIISLQIGTYAEFDLCDIK